jgi:hypothetical protein
MAAKTKVGNTVLTGNLVYTPGENPGTGTWTSVYGVPDLGLAYGQTAGSDAGGAYGATGYSSSSEVGGITSYNESHDLLTGNSQQSSFAADADGNWSQTTVDHHSDGSFSITTTNHSSDGTTTTETKNYDANGDQAPRDSQSGSPSGDSGGSGSGGADGGSSSGSGGGSDGGGSDNSKPDSPPDSPNDISPDDKPDTGTAFPDPTGQTDWDPRPSGPPHHSDTWSRLGWEAPSNPDWNPSDRPEGPPHLSDAWSRLGWEAPSNPDWNPSDRPEGPPHLSDAWSRLGWEAPSNPDWTPSDRPEGHPVAGAPGPNPPNIYSGGFGQRASPQGVSGVRTLATNIASHGSPALARIIPTSVLGASRQLSAAALTATQRSALARARSAASTTVTRGGTQYHNGGGTSAPGPNPPNKNAGKLSQGTSPQGVSGVSTVATNIGSPGSLAIARIIPSSVLAASRQLSGAALPATQISPLARTPSAASVAVTGAQYHIGGGTTH